MTIEELVPLTNGLTVTACGHTLVCDRARITPVRSDAIDMKFLVTGTDFVPRLRICGADDLDRTFPRNSAGTAGLFRGLKERSTG